MEQKHFRHYRFISKFLSDAFMCGSAKWSRREYYEIMNEITCIENNKG